MIDPLAEFVVPYQQELETEAAQSVFENSSCTPVTG